MHPVSFYRFSFLQKSTAVLYINFSINVSVPLDIFHKGIIGKFAPMIVLHAHYNTRIMKWCYYLPVYYYLVLRCNFAKKIPFMLCLQ